MRNTIYSLGLVVLLSACNLYGGLSKPSNDPQYLLAARACLDQGDYECAKTNYQALSSSYNDAKISETSLTVLAQNNIFSISDLVGSLGSSLGSASTLTSLSQVLANRGITTGAFRTVLKGQYDADSAIVDTKLKSFTKFIVALGMFNEVLANAVGADGVLTASDIVDASHVTACKAGNDCTSVACQTVGTCNCTTPAGTTLTYDATDLSDMDTATGTKADWSGVATIQKLINSASALSNELSGFSSSSQGFLKSIQDLKAISTISNSAGAQACARQTLLTVLSL